MRSLLRSGMLLSLVVIISLVAAAITPAVVFAEGDIPEAPPADVPPAVMEQPENDVPAAVELLAEAGAVIVQDGAALPLASQTTLTLLCDPDPWYYGSGPACPGGKCEYFGLTGLNQALNTWEENKGYGYVYIQNLDPGVYYTLGHYQIDALGGFATLKGLVADPGNTAVPLITGSLNISNFTAGFTIQGLKIATDINYPILVFNGNKGTIKIIDTELSGSNFEGLIIANHSGAIELNRVSVHDNKYFGVSINNCGTGATCAATGTVKITNSAIYNNGGEIDGTAVEYGGMSIQSASPILINGLTVSLNKGDGSVILAKNALSIKNSAFAGSMAFSNPANTFSAGLHVLPGTTGSITLENVLLRDNDGSGAWIETTGNITLKKVQAYANGYAGVRIGSVSPTLVPGGTTVSISDSQFVGNDNHNLLVVARGAVTLTIINASDSETKMGAWIDNTSALSALPVTITNSIFNDNYSRGLTLSSKGIITINSITVERNEGGDGAYLDNDYGFTSGITFLSTYGPNVFADNENVGLSIRTPGNLVMNNVMVYFNKGDGLDAGIMNSSGMGVGGNILWNGGGAWGNGVSLPYDSGVGAILDNTLKNQTRSITLRNVVFNDNKANALSNTYTNAGTGLYIKSKGPVTITNISANGNSFYGMYITSASTVTILRSLPSGNNTFNDNGWNIKGGAGLQIWRPTGSVVINRVEAVNNSGAGVLVDTQSGNVTISGTAGLPAVFSQNKGYYSGSGWEDHEGYFAGLQIDANTVRLTNIRANDNWGGGVYVCAYGAVSVLGVLNEFSRNSSQTDWGYPEVVQKYGLFIEQAGGPVSVLNFLAEENHGGGIFIDSTLGTGSVTLNSTVAGFTSHAYGNVDNTYTSVLYGMQILSRGAVTLNRVDVSNTYYSTGASIDNKNALTSLPVKVSLSSFNDNYGIGLEIISAGAITLNKVIASGNEESGSILDNDTITTGQVYMPITILNSTFNNNVGDGLDAYSKNTITVSSITANNNWYGLSLVNEYAVDKPVIMLGKNQFNNNAYSGLYISSTGLVNVTGLEAGNNVISDGIFVMTFKQVTISNSWVYGNGESGIKVFYAPVTISNVTSIGNDDFGLDVREVPLGGKLRLLNSSFIFNYNSGISVDFESNLETDLIMLNVNYFGNALSGSGVNIINN